MPYFPLLQRPAAVIVYDLVYGVHEPARFTERGNNALIVPNVVKGQRPALAIFEPLLTPLIAADVERPHVRRHPRKVLRLVDVASAYRMASIISFAMSDFGKAMG